VASALAESAECPGLLVLEGVPKDAAWPGQLANTPSGNRNPVLRSYHEVGCPTVTLAESSFEEWLAAKSSNFRREMRKLRRHYESAGGTVRRSTGQTLAGDIATFMRLHTSRWEQRGSSNFVRLGAALPAALEDLGRGLLEREGRFRLLMLEVDGEPISAQLFLAAGGRVLYINGGWEERFAPLKPSILGLLATIEEAIERGESSVDLGMGEQHYKQRFADRDDRIAWAAVIPGGRRLPVMLARTTPLRAQARLNAELKRRLSDAQLARLRRSLARLQRARAGPS
jgi:CelD/BcsL family acetyltransferase involved in cellulose biosynthesis